MSRIVDKIAGAVAGSLEGTLMMLSDLSKAPRTMVSVELYMNCKALRRQAGMIGRSLGGHGYLAGSSAESGEMGLSLTACVCLLTRASRMKARSASTVKMIAWAAAIQNAVFAPVSQIRRRCASYGHTRVKKIRRPML